jgi:ABC-type transport system involved in cytochrome c biogenesis ATPase subunit
MGMSTATDVELEISHDPSRSPLSARARQLRDLFGLIETAQHTLFASVAVPTDGIVLVTGYSGVGKSSLLRRVCATAAAATVDDLPDPGRHDRVIDLFEGDIHDVVSWLGRFGLGEPRLLLTRPDQLSDGQRHRLQLARLARTGAPLIAVDEFCSTLDRVTAHVIAFNFQRACRSLGISAVVATAHDDLHEVLQPDAHIRLDFDGRHRTDCWCHRRLRSPDQSLPTSLVEEAGTREDFERLAVYHYCSEDNHPIDWDQLVVEVRRIRFDNTVVAVKVFCRAFPPAFDSIGLLAAVNARVLFQERVIVHPAFRGMSLNARMWPTIGDQPLLFSQSALGRHFPFEVRAGYRRVPHPSECPLPEQLELESALRRLDSAVNVHSSNEIADLIRGGDARQAASLRDSVERAFVAHSIRHVRFLAGLVGVEGRDQDLDLIATACRSAVLRADPADLAQLAEESVPFPMAGFVRERTPR